ncbi:Zinc finger matrin-type protein 2 [Hondaea fermentalgiana]|uniref:Zinc finger matrin-type protein 2 n=1 Tax=Hondaea fermentalgiana TaxID=2315210 RepID=A0A2R5G8Z8_9STRA|nr:Zinc finger matrin-type protein 2 [Hondaea fermentalgiana]|eukprot:GBG27517.1 Zinc finger matrin-type protein 2 [Hondaea fermentalgiana]
MAGERSGATRGVSNIESRSWDREAFERRAREREDRERGAEAAVERRRLLEARQDDGFLHSRRETVDFFKDVGSRRMIDLEADGALTRQGYHCELCQRTFTDSSSYMQHLNSVQHQSKLGNSMAVRKATLSEVRQRIRERVELKYAKRAQAHAAATYDFESRVRELEELEANKREERAARKRKRKEERKMANNSANQAMDDQLPAEDAETKAMMAAMGISGFGSTKAG